MEDPLILLFEFPASRGEESKQQSLVSVDNASHQSFLFLLCPSQLQYFCDRRVTVKFLDDSKTTSCNTANERQRQRLYDQPPLFLDTPKQCAAKKQCEITGDARRVKRACKHRIILL